MPDHDLITQVLQSTAAASPAAALLLIAVKWLTTSNKELVTELNKERQARLDNMGQQINRLQARSDDCEKDRLNLHRQVAELQRVASCGGH
jgi:hypothetical protein